MAFQVTSYLGSQSYSAQKDRSILLGMERSEGVLNSTDCSVGQRGIGANWSVDVAPGWSFVNGDDISYQGLYATYNDAIVNVSFTTFAPVSNPRVDTIGIQVYDQESGISGTPQDQAFPRVLVGTENAAASTSNIVGQAAIPSTFFILGYAVIPTGAGSVLSAYLVDQRKISRPTVYGYDGHIYALSVDASGNFGTEKLS